MYNFYMEVSTYRAKQKKFAIRTWLVIGAFFVLLFTWEYFLGLVAFGGIYSEGNRVGQVVKFSQKGVLWKSWESGMGLTQSGAYVERWNFSVDNEDPNKAAIIQNINEAFRTGDLVRIRYEQRYGVLPWRAKTSYLVREVEFLTKDRQR